MSHDLTMELRSAIDPRVFRDVLGHYPTGVVVVAGVVRGDPVGMVVGSFSSVSLDPPLVSFMPSKTSETYGVLGKVGQPVCISVLAHDQIPLCRTLASKEANKWASVDWQPDVHGSPRIAGAVAHISGRISQEVGAGDHYITISSVDELEIARPVKPLLFFQGGYGGFSTTRMSAHLDESLIVAGRLAEASRPQLDILAERFGCEAATLVQISAEDQTVGASSYGGAADHEDRLGARIPLMPPLGEAAVAWDPDQEASWLARTLPQDSMEIAEYRRRAAAVRAQGYSIHYLEHGMTDLGAALNEYALGDLTPARDRVVRAAIAASDFGFGEAIRPDAHHLGVATITVPVFDPDSELRGSGLTLLLSQLPRDVDGATALEWVAALREAAAAFTQTLKVEARRDYDRYKASGLRRPDLR
jgi:flavin reductase (DIM6/NTAB) family NADH-FMN oxidoreductase RutF/DNA-binding IclR family transcriptional regulator